MKRSELTQIIREELDAIKKDDEKAFVDDSPVAARLSDGSIQEKAQAYKHGETYDVVKANSAHRSVNVYVNDKGVRC